MQDPVPFRLPFTHYAGLGYHPIPITYGTKVPSGGKNWNTIEYDYATLDRGKHSVGILCDNVVGIDIDVDDKKTAQKLERITRKNLGLPKVSPVRVGKAPKRLLIVRVDKPFKSVDIVSREGGKPRTLVQLLGSGKQFVIHGIHPDTQKPYTLSHALPHHDKLPLVTHTQLLELRAELCDALGVPIEPTRTGASGKGAQGEWTNTRWSEREVDHYALPRLMQIDPSCDRPTWIKVGMALHAGFHGDESGLNLFDEWSSGELHEVEVGNYVSKADVRSQWRSFKPGAVGTGTLDAIAKRHGFKDERTKTPEPREPAVGIDYSDLIGTEPTQRVWFVRDMFTGGAHLLVGRPKGGKSYLTLDLVLAVVRGEPFFSRPTTKTHVLWLAAEDTRDSLGERLRSRGVPLPRGSVTIYTMENPPSGDGTLHDWVDSYLADNPTTKLVIVDTQDSAEEIYSHRDEDDTTPATKRAYQISRMYEQIAQRHGACIVLVMHSRKRNGKAITDYHELVNMAQTVVAGATASIVLADHPERDPHEQDPRRVIAIRGRHIKHDEALMAEMTDRGFNYLGHFAEVERSEKQSELMRTLEVLVNDTEPNADGERWVTYQQLADSLGKTRRAVQGLFDRMRTNAANSEWRGKTMFTKAKLGVTLVTSVKNRAERSTNENTGKPAKTQYEPRRRRFQKGPESG